MLATPASVSLAASDKIAAMEAAGIKVAATPAEMGATLVSLL